MNKWGVYIIRCKDKSLYTGVALDVKKRLQEHQTGGPKAAKYLKGRGPLKMVWNCRVGERARAQSLEYRLKQLSKETKEALIKGRLKLNDLIVWV